MKYFFFVFCAVVVAVTCAKKLENQVPLPAASERHERHIPHHEEIHHGHHGHHGDVVDFGAHTGEKGSFGWYADFPVQTDH